MRNWGGEGQKEAQNGAQQAGRRRNSKNGEALAQLWLLHPWKCPRPGWMGLEQPGIEEGVPTLDQG